MQPMFIDFFLSAQPYSINFRKAQFVPKELKLSQQGIGEVGDVNGLRTENIFKLESANEGLTRGIKILQLQARFALGTLLI